MLNFIKKKNILIFFILLLLVFIYPCSYIFYKLKKCAPVPNYISNTLIGLGAQSLLSNDVPVGAIIMYNDTVLGVGYNTVMKDSVAFGHAEINAITAALKKIGLSKFQTLDRNKLLLYTTLEPCEMCKGALIEYRIKKVFFMKSKSMTYWFKERNWEWVYEYNKSQINGEMLQDFLLNKHPHYHPD